ncbi:MAG: hypothetical protein K1X88_03065 [Nannocystaceae bacterium]|nr:hypothetical protein [Nannocystaceae bacterium]
MGHGIDASQLPQLAQYVARLPAGLASYPECRSRGTLVLSAAEGHELSPWRDAMPPEVWALIEQPPLPGAWVPAVLSDAVFFAVVDTHYPRPEQVVQWTRERTLRTARSRMYRALTRISGPSMVLRMSAAVHGMFQKGTDLDATRTDDGMTLRLTHPPHLHGGSNHLANVGMFEVLLEIATARPSRVEMLESEPQWALYHARWG